MTGAGEESVSGSPSGILSLPIPISFRRLLWGLPTLTAYALLVVPFVAGVLETSWMTPLALPGYLVYVVGTAIGNTISPGLSLWVYWGPFFVGCYGLAVGIGYGYAVFRPSTR
ncbi:hypothetical protein [Natronoglomus mannanivorans]|uniref:Uncharacterized protein n=1 Tax=Natronoglomus mannanivorans TaxID=2979990 RepID=A0AAP2YY41_9EURY|nr:hypothetical protein [Halobacteria archaeon AArc-xg1-1]